MQSANPLTLSNLLSLARIFLLIPIIINLAQNTRIGDARALAFMILAVITDYCDGYLARKLNQISDIGKVLDPVADKICILGVCVALSSPLREIPLPAWFVPLVILRELVILGGGYLIYRRYRYVTMSNVWGKISTSVLAVLLLRYVMHDEFSFPGAFLVSHAFLLRFALLFLILSTLSYAWSFYLTMGERKINSSRAESLNDSTQ